MSLNANHRLLTAAEERDLLVRSQAGDKAARDALVMHNQGLIKMLMGGHRDDDHRMPKEDLEAACQVGLLEAVDKFNLDFTVRFSTYAYYQIRRKISGSIQDIERFDRVQLVSDADRYHYLKLVTGVGHEGVSEYEFDVKDKLRRSLRSLSRVERQAISLTCGLKKPPLTLRAAGQIMGMSGERVRQLRERGMLKLRVKFKVNELTRSEVQRLKEVY